MTQRYMLKIARKYNIDNVDKAIDACEFVEELLKEMTTEMICNDESENIIQSYMDANWAVGDLAEEIEVMDKEKECE
mgnify:CR=1 FL=1